MPKVIQLLHIDQLGGNLFQSKVVVVIILVSILVYGASALKTQFSTGYAHGGPTNIPQGAVFYLRESL